MNCPYCSAAMEEGRLEAWQRQAIYWIPREANMARLSLRTVKKAMEEEKAIALGKWTNRSTTEVPQLAFCCRECGVIIAKYK